jgi:hypothetical protein
MKTNNLKPLTRWRLVASEAYCTIIRVEDWVNRNYRKDKGTTVYYIIEGQKAMKNKELSDFLYMYEPT